MDYGPPLVLAMFYAKADKASLTTAEVPDLTTTRTKVGLTQNAFARRFNLSPGTVRERHRWMAVALEASDRSAHKTKIKV